MQKETIDYVDFYQTQRIENQVVEGFTEVNQRVDILHDKVKLVDTKHDKRANKLARDNTKLREQLETQLYLNRQVSLRRLRNPIPH